METAKQAIDLATANPQGDDDYWICDYKCGGGEWGLVMSTPFSSAVGLVRGSLKEMRPVPSIEEVLSSGVPGDVVLAGIVGKPDKLDDRVPEITRIVLTGPNGEVIQPVSEEPDIEEYTNAYGVKRQTRGSICKFKPESVAPEGGAIVVFGDGSKKTFRFADFQGPRIR
jgi:hypothetical protein